VMKQLAAKEVQEMWEWGEGGAAFR
jgi:hypothetical protein